MRPGPHLVAQIFSRVRATCSSARGTAVAPRLAAVTLFLFGCSSVRAVDPAVINPANRIDPAAAEWGRLASSVARDPRIEATFQEFRHFAFRTAPVALRGIVRVSADQGLSLQYTEPEERLVIVDRGGMLLRDRNGNQPAPADPRASAANEALLHILRLNLSALAAAHDVYGRREGDDWLLALVPRDEAVRRAIGDIFVEGHGATVRRIELRRSERQRIEIRIDAPREVTSTPDQWKRYFR